MSVGRRNFRVVAQIAEFNQLLLDPEIAVLYERLQDPEGNWPEYSVDDRRRARSILFFLFRHADIAYYQFERGMLPEARLTSAIAPLLDDAGRPLYRAFWEDVKGNFVQIPAIPRPQDSGGRRLNCEPVA